MRDLTPGEKRAFKAYVVYETHESAAKVLGISPQTLKNHLGSIYKKLDRHKAHAALYRLALEFGCDPLLGAEDFPLPSANGSLLQQDVANDMKPSPLAEAINGQTSPASILERDTE